MIGFSASGEVTTDDFKHVLQPEVDRFMKHNADLNYILELNTGIKNFSAGAWFQDAMLGIKHLTNWNRSAIITDDDNISRFTDLFSKIMPGEFRAFPHLKKEEAIKWVSGKKEAHT
ncbi:MAG: STAS/SEC14 domain-containing protein [Proteobacteria bacterium]|nr:MAG: STAS/SEC14 domain-containing protein [Pseudomonadota bacterium]